MVNLLEPILASRNNKIEKIFKYSSNEDENQFFIHIENSQVIKIKTALQNKKIISAGVLNIFMEIKNIKISLRAKMINSFSHDFFEEVPDDNLYIPVDLIESWYTRFILGNIK
jgi:hypothetical protein